MMSASSKNGRPSPSRKDDSEQKSLLQRYGPLRLIAPWACMIAGMGLVVRGLIDTSEGGAGGMIWVGAAVLVVGVVGGLAAMWMARRGL